MVTTATVKKSTNRKIKPYCFFLNQTKWNKNFQIPSTIGEEKKINPFMRVNESVVQSHAGLSEGIGTMAYIRKEKDTFKANL